MLELVLIISLLSLLVSLGLAWRVVPPRTKQTTAVLLDTSALIDGRIMQVVNSGFMSVRLLIPRFVIKELQLLADKADHSKRERARFGLQVIQDLQDSRFAEVAIINQDIPTESGVDEKLVQLALKTGAQLFTTDFNLLKVAEIEGIRVLNVNQLAQQLRPSYLPGEQTELKIVQKGQDRGQGVGYLDDGTMVVVEKAGNKIGANVVVEFTRNLQTSAGRMMFAKPLAQSARTEKPVPKTRPQTVEDKLIQAINSK